MTAASTPTTITSDIASINQRETVTTRTIDEAQYHTAPAQLFPNSVQEEIHSTRVYNKNPNGDEFIFNNTSIALSTPGYSDVFQARMQHSIQKMIGFAQANNQFKPVISLQNVDYGDFGLHSTKEYFQVDSDTLQNIKSDPRLKKLGFTALAKPTGNPKNPFELTVCKPDGKVITGSEWNEFFDFYHNLPAEETQIA